MPKRPFFDMKFDFILVAASVAFLPILGLAQDGGGELDGMVFEDKNKDGIRDAGEIGRSGIVVDVLDSEGQFIARVVTDADGRYGFEGLVPGVYFLRFEFSPGFAVRSKGIEVGGEQVVFTPVPVIGPDSNYSFLRLNLVNPANFRGQEVSAFTP